MEAAELRHVDLELVSAQRAGQGVAQAPQAPERAEGYRQLRWERMGNESIFLKAGSYVCRSDKVTIQW